MRKEIQEYEQYLLNFGEVKKPQMPKFDLLAYTDSEYLSAIFDTLEVFDFVDDEYLTIKHLKGD